MYITSHTHTERERERARKRETWNWGVLNESIGTPGNQYQLEYGNEIRLQLTVPVTECLTAKQLAVTISL